MEKEEIVYAFVPGPFTRTLVKALRHPDRNFLLIVEEINRANPAPLSGDVFQLVHREERRSEYTVAASEEGAPYFEEARLVLVCRKLYWQDLDPTHFVDGGEIDAKHYPGKDYHRMFIGEVVEVLRKV